MYTMTPILVMAWEIPCSFIFLYNKDIFCYFGSFLLYPAGAGGPRLGRSVAHCQVILGHLSSQVILGHLLGHLQGQVRCKFFFRSNSCFMHYFLLIMRLFNVLIMNMMAILGGNEKEITSQPNNIRLPSLLVLTLSGCGLRAP